MSKIMLVLFTLRGGGGGGDTQKPNAGGSL